MSILLLILAITILVIAFVVIQILLILGTDSYDPDVSGFCSFILILEIAAAIIGILFWAIGYVITFLSHT